MMFGGNVEQVLKDSGERREFEHGAVRDMSYGKGRYDLLQTQMLHRLAKHLENGARKYEERNWEKGIPFASFIDSAERHINKYVAGWNDEDHLAAAVWNLACVMTFEHRMPDLNNLPERQLSIEELQKFCWFKEE